MARQLDKVREEKQARQDKAVLIAVEYGLEDAVQASKRHLKGFSAKYTGDGWLLTLRASLGEEDEVAFVGGATLGGALTKAVREIGQDMVSWREDKWANKS